MRRNGFAGGVSSLVGLLPSVGVGGAGMARDVASYKQAESIMTVSDVAPSSKPE